MSGRAWDQMSKGVKKFSGECLVLVLVITTSFFLVKIKKIDYQTKTPSSSLKNHRLFRNR